MVHNVEGSVLFNQEWSLNVKHEIVLPISLGNLYVRIERNIVQLALLNASDVNERKIILMKKVRKSRNINRL